jgi:hypothetical protein
VAEPLVKPEFGPTLPALLAPRLRAMPAPARAALALLAVGVVAVVAWLLLRTPPGEHAVVVTKPIAFNLIYNDPLQRDAPIPPEVLRLATPPGAADPQRLTVRPLHLPAYKGDPSGFLPLYTEQVVADLATRFTGFVRRGDGRTRVLDTPGYAIIFQAREHGRTVYGRDVLLVPDQPGARDGLDVLLVSARSAAVPNAVTVGASGLLKTPLRSVRFGTARP